MRLSRLELFGFKSFLNRTVFRFTEGVTAIVGPNGCGKSNIVDAIIWALGERGTKSLRVKDMGDVIFHGSNGKRPVNVAEVGIELSEGGHDVLVKRRIYRDGSNEYYMNGATVRLKDIQDFFLGTGIGTNTYAIVEQGKIEHFIQMKPQERKIVVEETSGVTRFEEKKRDAFVRLEEVSKNLERIEDINREVTKAFEKATDEWDRWRTYSALNETLREIDAQILIAGYKRLTTKIEKMREKQEDLEKEIQKNEGLKAVVQKELEMKEEEFSVTDTFLRQLEVDMKAKEKDMENRLLEMEYLQEELRRLEDASVSASKRMTDLDAGTNRTTEEIGQIRLKTLENKQLLKGEEEAAEALKHQCLDLKTSMERREKQIEDIRVKLFVSMSKLTEIKNRIAEIERTGQEKARREQKRLQEQQRLREKLVHLDGERKGLQETLQKAKQAKEDLIKKDRDISAERDRISRAVNDKKNAVERLRGEQKAKEQFLKGFAKDKEGPVAPPPDASKLIDIVKVEEGAEGNLERFFFKEMGYYVVTADNMQAVAEMVSKYNENFIFLSRTGLFKLNGAEVEIGVRPVSDLTEALLRIDEGEEGVFLSEDAYIDSRGIILREQDVKRIDLRRFKEKIRVEKELKEIDRNLKESMTVLMGLQSTQGDLERSLKELKAAIRAAEDRISDCERQVILSDAQWRSGAERLRELEERVDYPEEMVSAPTEDLLSLQGAEEKGKGRLETEIGSLRRELDEIKKMYEIQQAKWHETAIGIERRRNLLHSLGRDSEQNMNLIETLSSEKAALEEAVVKVAGDIKSRLSKIEGLEKDYEELKAASEMLTNRYEELKKASGDLHMERTVLQEKIAQITQDKEKLKGRMENSEREIAVLAEKKETIQEGLSAAYGIDNPAQLAFSRERDLDAEREVLVKQMSDLGEINFRAEKEYTELKDRVAFLGTQMDDLRNATDSLKKTISKMDHLSREMFLETFHTVDDAFKKFTQMLFKGGTGYLNFNQETQGIDMYVQPPGKKVIRMELLSGGEKALISLAFLFSLMDTNPSPFSLLDEIDAPLDDANLASLLEIVKTLSAKTQILFITHNRITMESSDTIYGVTMEEEGVSKVVSVRL